VHNAQLDAFKCRSFIALLMNYQLTVRARFWSRVAPSIAAETVEDAPRNMGEDELIHFRCYYYRCGHAARLRKSRRHQCGPGTARGSEHKAQFWHSAGRACSCRNIQVVPIPGYRK